MCCGKAANRYTSPKTKPPAPTRPESVPAVFSMLSSAFCLLSSVRYGRAGKTPCMAIQKFTVRNGIMLLCGKLPPAG